MERQTQSEAEMLQFFDLGTRPDRQLQRDDKITRGRSNVQHSILRLRCFTGCWKRSSQLETGEGAGNSYRRFQWRTENFFMEKWADLEGILAAFRSQVLVLQTPRTVSALRPTLPKVWGRQGGAVWCRKLCWARLQGMRSQPHKVAWT